MVMLINILVGPIIVLQYLHLSMLLCGEGTSTYAGVDTLLANEIVSQTILQIQAHFERLMNQEYGRKITGENSPVKSVMDI